MPTPNLYWPIYKNLEKEFLELANYMHFSSDQIDVYSMHIADLIVRCSIEIEAISKELYLKNDGNPSPTDDHGEPRKLYFDTDCLNFLETKWMLSKKQIMVSAINFYFTNEKHTIISPLYKANKRGSSGSKWKQAYQALKHDRKNTLEKATVGNLLHAMGALYILNIYFSYFDQRINLGRMYLQDPDFDNRVGSEIFSCAYISATMVKISEHMDDSCIQLHPDGTLERSIFIIKYDDKTFEEMSKDFCFDSQTTMRNVQNSPEIQIFLEQHPEYKEKGINKICIDAGGVDLLRRIVSLTHMTSNTNGRKEAMLNKHENIYPEVFPTEDQPPNY